tara:strand:- start:914 stop:3247 length:2334 start_codon:yes stop_codon:yes gene_type:complete
MKNIIFIFLITLNSSYLLCQNKISGIIYNEETESLIGVNISVENNLSLGTSSNFNGDYSISLPDGCHQIKFQYIGYETLETEICLYNDTVFKFNPILKYSSELINTVVVSAGKFEQKIEEVTVSMDVIKPSLIENKSATSLDKTMSQSPSVHIVDGQANIRSGSGWSYGAGSRVMVMVDGIPILNSDRAGAEWQLIPMENISQIEVIKGASSVLFGSSALNGTINIRTAYPTSKPLNKLTITHSIYDKPKRKSLHWYKGNYQSLTNTSFLHSHKKNNSDFVFSLNLFDDESFIENGNSRRARINLSKTKYIKNKPGSKYGARLTLMRSKICDPVIWQHDTLAYRALDNDPTFYDYSYLMLDPFLVLNNEERNIKYTLNSRLFYRDMRGFDFNDISANILFADSSTFSSVIFTDFQIQKIINENLTTTSGYTFKFDRGRDGKVYGSKMYINNSIYSQFDYKKNRLNISLGSRFENFNLSGEKINKVIFRGGINYKLGEGTFVRGSYGEGIRIPSMIERYVNFNTGPMQIYPNENLSPETGYSAEIGIKQGVKIKNWKGFIDLAGFLMNYHDMMEFSFGYWGEPTDPGLAGLGFKSVNIGDSNIKGIELSIAGEGKIGETEIQLLGGYTYTKPVIRDANLEYESFSNSLGNFPVSYFTTSIDSSAATILKYRYRNLAKFDINIEKNRLMLGSAIRYNSKMENIDYAFVGPAFDLLLGTTDAWERLNKNVLIIDLRLGYRLNEDSWISFNIDNIFNTEQSPRPASLLAPRIFSILLNYSL